jgi:hypothetical protein
MILICDIQMAAATTTASSTTKAAAATTTKKTTTAAIPKTTATSVDPTDTAASSSANTDLGSTMISNATASTSNGGALQQTQIPIITQVYGGSSGGAQLAVGSGGFILAVSLALAFAQ